MATITKNSDTMPLTSRTVPDAPTVLKLDGKKLGVLNLEVQEIGDLSHLTNGLPTPKTDTVAYILLVSNPNNPRSAEHVSDNATDLLPSIRLEGLKTPLVVERHSNGKYLILQGESRYVALGRAIKDGTLPKDLKTGIPCIVYEGLTTSQRESIINDHGTSRGLTRPETVQKCWALYNQQVSKQEIAVIMRGALLQSCCKPATTTQLRSALASIDPTSRPAIAAACWHVFRQTLGEQILTFATAPAAIRDARLAWERVVCGEITSETAEPLYKKAGFKPDGAAAMKLSSALKNDVKNGLWVPGEGGPIWKKTVADLSAPAIKTETTKGPSYAKSASELLEFAQMHARHPALRALLTGLTDKDSTINVNPIQTALEFIDAVATMGPQEFQDAIRARSVNALQSFLTKVKVK